MADKIVNDVQLADLSDLTQTLAGYVAANKLTPDHSGSTDVDGKLPFTELESGLYLVVGESIVIGDDIYVDRPRYTPNAILLQLPMLQDDTWNNGLTVTIKYQKDTVVAEPRLVEHKALAVWADTGYEADRPEAVTVYLLRNGGVCDTVTLNAEVIDGGNYVGILSIPALERTLPVLKTCSDANLKTAPCCYAGSPYQNDLIIAAHSYIRHFGRLAALRIGDGVTFTDLDGNVFSYEVIEVTILPGTAVAEMSEGEWDLTLFTCTVSGQERVTVRCRLQ